MYGPFRRAERLPQPIWTHRFEMLPPSNPVTGNVGAIRPYARATWEIDSKDQDRSIGASSVTLGGNYSIPVAKPDNSYALFSLGASTEIGKVTGFIAGSATASRADANYWAVTVGLRLPL